MLSTTEENELRTIRAMLDKLLPDKGKKKTKREIKKEEIKLDAQRLIAKQVSKARK